MALNTRRLRSQENDLKLANVKVEAIKIDGTQQTRRPALGDLGNRAKNSNIVKTELQTLKPTYLKTVKPRVDTHWKKTVNPSSTTAVQPRKNSKETIKIEKPLINANENVAANSIKLDGIAKLVKIKTLQLMKPVNPVRGQIRKEKSNENVSNLPQPRQQQPQQQAIIGDQKKKNSGAMLVRQESILTRRSLGKSSTQSAGQKEKEKIVLKKDDFCIGVDDPLLKVTSSHSTILINEVVNIDENDDGNTMLLPVYVNDIYNYLNEMELKCPIHSDHLKNQKEVTPKMRAVLIDWINEVHYQFHLVLETFHMTVSIIDRYLQATTNTSKQNLQLVGVTALYLASKYEELYPPDTNDFEYITDNAYSKKQILRMEKHIFKTLDFQLGKPLPIHFLRRYSKATSENESATSLHHTMAKYFIELASIEYNLAKYRPSEIAAASLYLSLKILTNKSHTEFWTSTLHFYTNYNSEHLRPIARLLAEVAQNAPNAKLKSVYNKYKLDKFDQIALRSELQEINLNNF